MREIKFRAWDEKQLVMHNDFQFIKSGNEGNDWIVFTSDKQTLTDKPHPFDNHYFSQQLKIMQYTGLKDKNGRGIYEGDILKGAHLEFAVEIKFIEQAFRRLEVGYTYKYSPSVLHSDNISKHRLEIIGNIYENPELIKQ